MVLAIIPARGGSKRIPKKNIKLFFGKPLISYAIKAAKKAGLFDRIVVSTDSEEIKEIALNYGAEVPFLRPANLADDFVTTVPVLKDALSYYTAKGEVIDYFCNIFCNPFILPEDIINSFQLLKQKKCTGIIPVTTFSFPVYRSLRIGDDGECEYVFPEYAASRSQDLEEKYHDVGQFYWWDYDKFFSLGENMMQDRVAYVLSQHLSRDLDTPEDWKISEMLYSIFVKGERNLNEVI